MTPLLSINTIRQRLAKLREERKQFEAKQEAERVELMARCPHVWSHCPDPSGGSDSDYGCDVCGKRVRNRPAEKKTA